MDQGSESDADCYDTSRNKSRVSQMSAVSSLFTDVTDEGTRRTRRSHRSKAKTQEQPEIPPLSREVTVISPLPPTTFVKYGKKSAKYCINKICFTYNSRICTLN